MKIILVNGPPRAGKSTLARLFQGQVHYTRIWGFSYHLKQMVHTIYLGREGFYLDPDHFDAVKKEPQEVLGGMSWREAYIFYSEKVIKPKHGKEWFGDQFLKCVVGEELVVVPDSGFVEEAERVMRHVGRENTLLIRLHKDGTDFSGDSRSYISLPGVLTIDATNVDADYSELTRTAIKPMLSWFK